MKIAFFHPPAAQSAGGIAAALHSLKSTLIERGHEITPELRPDTDVAHFHGLWQLAFHKVARQCRARSLPYLVSPHGMLEPWAFRSKRWKKLPFFHLLEKPFLKRASTLLATSTIESNNLKARLPGQRVGELPLGLTGDAQPRYDDARRSLEWAPEEKVLLYLSRIDRKKGLDILLRALADIPLPDARLVIVGGGDSHYLAECRRIAAEFASTLPPIEWRGEVWGDARWPLLQGADLFCLPTHSENFGLAILESLQVGTPVLTTRFTPWPDLMQKRPGAFFCAPEVASVGTAARAFRGSEWTEAQRTDLAAWAHAEFNWNSLGRKYEALYRNLVSV